MYKEEDQPIQMPDVDKMSEFELNEYTRELQKAVRPFVNAMHRIRCYRSPGVGAAIEARVCGTSFELFAADSQMDHCDNGKDELLKVEHLSILAEVAIGRGKGD